MHHSARETLNLSDLCAKDVTDLAPKPCPPFRRTGSARVAGDRFSFSPALYATPGKGVRGLLAGMLAVTAGSHVVLLSSLPKRPFLLHASPTASQIPLLSGKPHWEEEELRSSALFAGSVAQVYRACEILGWNWVAWIGIGRRDSPSVARVVGCAQSAYRHPISARLCRSGCDSAAHAVLVVDCSFDMGS